MKHVSILLLNHVNIASMETARNGLLEANKFLRLKGKQEFFCVELVGIQHFVTFQNGSYTVKADKILTGLRNTDLIIIPPVQTDLQTGLKDNRMFLPWIKEQYHKGAEVASLCLGAFILGMTGLLNGKRCVTHWKASAQFTKLFPNVLLEPENLLTDDAGIYTGGGAFSSANLVLYLIEKYINRETAIYCSKIFQIDMGRNSQSEFIIFTGQKDHSDKEIKEIQEFLEINYAQKLIVNELCERFYMVRRTLERRFKLATGNTVLEYIQRIRVEAAKRQLEHSRKTINEVMYEVGYSDPKSFREVFRKYSGLGPLEYKNKYQPSSALELEI